MLQPYLEILPDQLCVKGNLSPEMANRARVNPPSRAHSLVSDRTITSTFGSVLLILLIQYFRSGTLRL
jgi:hypothetical protein